MNHCERCLSLMDETSTVCDRCGHEVEHPAGSVDGEDPLNPEQQADLFDPPVAARVVTAPPESAPVSQPRGPLGPREMVIMVLAVVGAGVVTLSLLMLRGSAAPSAVAAAAIAPRPPVTTSAPTTTAYVPSAKRWTSANSRPWVGNTRKGVAFELQADNRVAVWTRQVQPLLVVRCTAGEVEVFVFTETAAKIEPQTDDHTVRYALDDGAESSERWADSVDHDGLFARDGAALAKQLARARTMRFGFTPHNAAPVTVRFHVAGLAELMAPAARKCGLQ